MPYFHGFLPVQHTFLLPVMLKKHVVSRLRITLVFLGILVRSTCTCIYSSISTVEGCRGSGGIGEGLKEREVILVRSSMTCFLDYLS